MEYSSETALVVVEPASRDSAKASAARQLLARCRRVCRVIDDVEPTGNVSRTLDHDRTDDHRIAVCFQLCGLFIASDEQHSEQGRVVYAGLVADDDNGLRFG